MTHLLSPFLTAIAVAVAAADLRAPHPEPSAPALRATPYCNTIDSASKLSGKLVVLVPGLEHTTDDWEDLIEFLRTDPALQLGGAAFLCFDHQLGYFSTTNPTRIARDIAATTAAYWEAMRKPGVATMPEVILVAHSGGAMLARAAHLIGLGALEGEVVLPQQWAQSVERLVLLAGVGRGAKPGKIVNGVNAAVQRLPGVGSATFVGQQMLRGAPFITNVRLSTIEAFRRDTGNVPIIVQLLGTDDKVVGESDNVDLQVIPTAFQLHVARATHSDIIHTKWTGNDEARQSAIRDAFLRSADSVRKTARAIGALSTRSDAKPVFVLLHGIRSSASSWPVGMETTLERLGVNRRRIRRPNYGYFHLGNYLSGSARESETSQFLDDYVAFRSQFPNQPTDVVAHSFGTHILANALRTVPAFKVRNVVLAGSMLPSDFPWAPIFERNQARSVVSIAGVSDWTVGFASSLASGFPGSTVGAAAIEQFIGTSVIQCAWVAGKHSAPVDTIHHTAIATALVGNEPGDVCRIGTKSSPSGELRFAARTGPTIGKVLFYGGLTSMAAIVANGRTPTDRWRRAGWIAGSATVASVTLSWF